MYHYLWPPNDTRTVDWGFLSYCRFIMSFTAAGYGTKPPSLFCHIHDLFGDAMEGFVELETSETDSVLCVGVDAEWSKL
jgi:hypothetical protein